MKKVYRRDNRKNKGLFRALDYLNSIRPLLDKKWIKVKEVTFDLK